MTIRKEADLRIHIKPVLYRPYDRRLIFYHDSLVWRTVKQVMKHMLLGQNLGLITTRQTRDQWDVLVTPSVIGHKALAAYDINTLFPLYIYTTSNAKKTLFDEDAEKIDAPGGRRANLAPEFIAEMEKRLGMAFVPDGKGNLGRPHPPAPSPTAKRKHRESTSADRVWG